MSKGMEVVAVSSFVRHLIHLAGELVDFAPPCPPFVPGGGECKAPIRFLCDPPFLARRMPERLLHKIDLGARSSHHQQLPHP